MTSPWDPAADPGAVAAGQDPRHEAASDLGFGSALVGVLAVIGALLGLVWAAWSPSGPRALLVRPGVFIPDETESFVAGDGRFLVLVAIVGVLAGFLAWTRVGRRGPLVAAALALGGVIGALLTELVGHLTGGGTFDGVPNTIINALPLSLHIPGLVLVESVAALLVYGLLAAFAVDDDLGHADPVRDRLRPSVLQTTVGPPPGAGTPSVGAGDHPQYGGEHGDAPGPLQQGDLSAQ